MKRKKTLPTPLSLAKKSMSLAAEVVHSISSIIAFFDAKLSRFLSSVATSDCGSALLRTPWLSCLFPLRSSVLTDQQTCLCWTLHLVQWYKSAILLEEERSFPDRQWRVLTLGSTLRFEDSCFPLKSTDLPLNNLCSLSEAGSRLTHQCEITEFGKMRVVHIVVNLDTCALNRAR